MDWAAGRRKGLGEVAALTQGNAVLKARTTFRCALQREGKVLNTYLDSAMSYRKTLIITGLTSDQSRVTHFGGQDWLLQDSLSIGRWVKQWVSSSVSSSAGPIFLIQRTVLVLIPPSHVFGHSDQSPINHLVDGATNANSFVVKWFHEVILTINTH